VIFNDSFQELTTCPEVHSPFCRIIRANEEALQQCMRCDKEACVTAKNHHSIHIYKCHAGLTEAIAPIFFNDLNIGYLFLGQIFSYPDREAGWENIEKQCKAYDVDMALLKAACFELPLVSEGYITAASNILNAIASSLYLEQMVVLKQQDLSVQIDSYIISHVTENIGVREICEYFRIGKTHLYEISRQIYGTGIADHIRKLRIAKAKTLLTENQEISIKEIAFACGFSGYNYFFTTFKSSTGLSPNQFRKQAGSP
jgi:AraC-like DNA-binding protein